jgi:hypothetical protein
VIILVFPFKYVPGRNKYRNMTLQVGSLKNRIDEICLTQNYRSHFLSEEAPHIIKSATV